VMRASWRDPSGTWRDALLMEYVVGQDGADRHKGPDPLSRPD